MALPQLAVSVVLNSNGSDSAPVPLPQHETLMRDTSAFVLVAPMLVVELVTARVEVRQVEGEPEDDEDAGGEAKGKTFTAKESKPLVANVSKAHSLPVIVSTANTQLSAEEGLDMKGTGQAMRPRTRRLEH